jgi:hypothetical protein
MTVQHELRADPLEHLAELARVGERTPTRRRTGHRRMVDQHDAHHVAFAENGQDPLEPTTL